jgi:WD40 repeat protein
MLSPSYAAEPQIQQLSQLLRDIAAGHLQVPRFQRPPVWTAAQRLELLRSVAQGLPIGSILVWRTIRTDLQTVPKMGPHLLPSPPPGNPVRSYVLDGLQRLSTLFGALYPRDSRSKDDGSDWDIYYRLEDQDFSAGPAPSPLPADWLPLWLILDSPTLLRFQRNLLQKYTDREHWLTAADALQKVLLEYKIPVIPFVTDDLDRATLAFQRINGHFTPMSMPDMLAALTYREGAQAFDLRERLAALRSRLAGPKWATLAEQALIDACKAALGLRLDTGDVEATAQALSQSGSAGAYDQVAERLNRATQLLTRHQITGPVLLAGPEDVALLSEAMRSDSSEQDVWRWFVYHLYHGETQVTDELEEVRALAAQRPWALRPFLVDPLPLRFDFGSRRGKALALLLLSYRPWHAGAEELTNAPDVLADYGEAALPQFFPTGEGIDGPENRMVCRPDEVAALRWRIIEQTALCSDEMLRSHLIGEAAKNALLQKDRKAFLRLRRREIERAESFWLHEIGLRTTEVPPEPDATEPWSQRVVLRLSRLRKMRPHLALTLAKAAVERRSAPTLLSELAQSIVSSRRRPFYPRLPVQGFWNDQPYWTLSQDGRRALIWPGFFGWAATVIDLETGESVALEGTENSSLGGQIGSFSPDGTKVATVESGRDEESGLRVWESATGRLVAKDDDVHGLDVEFSPDGKQILVYRSGGVATGPDGQVVLWSPEHGAQVLCQAMFPRAHFSSDGKRILLSASRSPEVSVLSLADGTVVDLKPPDAEPVWEDHGIDRCEFSPDSTRVLTCSEDMTARIWGIDGQIQAVFLSHRAGLSWGAWHPDGSVVVTLDEHGAGWIWDVNGKATGSFRMEDSGRWRCAWNADGSRLMVYNFHGGRVYIFDRDGQRLAELDDDGESINIPCWHPDGLTVYGLSRGVLGRWSGIEKPLAALKPKEVVDSAAFSPDSTTVLTLRRGKGTTLWSLDGKCLRDFPVTEPSHRHVASFSPDGKRLLTVSHKDGVAVLDLSRGTSTSLVGHDHHQRDALQASFSPQGDRILTISNDGAALLWSADGAPLAILGDHLWGVSFGAFSPDGRRVMTVDAHGTLRLWSTKGPFLALPPPTEKEGNYDWRSGRFGAYTEHGKRLKAPRKRSPGTPGAKLLGIGMRAARSGYVGRWPSFSPDGDEIILPDGTRLSGHGTEWLQWGGNAFAARGFGKELGITPRAVDATFSPDGQRFATAHSDAARIWSRDGRLILQLAKGIGHLWLVRFSPDSRRLLTVAEAGSSIQIWSADTGDLLVDLPGPGDPILNAIFSPDGHHILIHAVKTLSGWGVLTKGYAWIWPSDEAGLLALAATRTDHELTPDELHLYLQ